MNISLLKKNLEKLNYQVSYFENRNDAIEYLLYEIKNTTIGIGGSMTIDELGLYDLLKKNNKVFWHWKNDSREDASKTEIYLSSVNGIAETGEIINIDGNCNRIASIVYGHKKVYFILGVNKIADNYDSALARARNLAAVKNAIRLNRNTPCVKAGKCLDCSSPERICCGLSVLWKKPTSCDCEVVLINEELGY